MKIRAYNQKTKGMIYSDDTTSEKLEEKMIDFWTGMQLGVDIAGADLVYMLFSGEVDDNQKEIYDRDILKVIDEEGKERYVEVQFDKGGFLVQHGDDDEVTSIGFALDIWHDWNNDKCYVAGNALQNPELLPVTE